jgi:hypothetical protein
MTERMSHEEYVLLCRSRAGEIASAVIGGEIPILLAPRLLCDALSGAEVPWDDSDLFAVRMIDSELASFANSGAWSMALASNTGRQSPAPLN